MTDEPRRPTTWLDPGGCSSCIYCGMDMTMDPYCIHPKVVKALERPEVGINEALRVCEHKLHKDRDDVQSS